MDLSPPVQVGRQRARLLLIGAIACVLGLAPTVVGAVEATAIRAKAVSGTGVSPVKKQRFSDDRRDAGATSSSCGARAHDQIWLISARRASCSSANGCSQLKYWVYDGQGGWLVASREAFLATDEPGIPTTFWVHGNRATHRSAVSIGWSVYRRLAGCAKKEQPLRFVIWSWPSDQVRGPLRDVRSKGARANAHGYYLGWLLDQIQPQVRINLIAYSFGARVTTGALHLVGGGSVAGRKLPRRSHPDRLRMHAVLMASAEDRDWLLPGHTHGRALSQVDQLVLFNNPCDQVLRRYRWIARYRPQALGYLGLASYRLPAADRHKVTQVNICSRQHDWRTYFYSPNVIGRLKTLAFGAVDQMVAQR